MDFREIHIPLVVKDGKLVLRGSEAELPDFHEGAEAELRIGASYFQKPEDARPFLKEATLLFLHPGSMLAAEVTRSRVPEALKEHLVALKPGTFGVPFKLKEALYITLITGKKGRLEDCECVIPSLDGLETRSINESYTRISERFEPTRRSHSGNVFSKVYYTADDPAIPLEVFRKEIEANQSTEEADE